RLELFPKPKLKPYGVIRKLVPDMSITTWWDFGSSSSHAKRGRDPWGEVQCAFCPQRGTWTVVATHQRKQPSGKFILHFDTAQCGNCGNFILAFWSSVPGSDWYAVRTVPYPI